MVRCVSGRRTSSRVITAMCSGSWPRNTAAVRPASKPATSTVRAPLSGKSVIGRATSPARSVPTARTSCTNRLSTAKAGYIVSSGPATASGIEQGDRARPRPAVPPDVRRPRRRADGRAPCRGRCRLSGLEGLNVEHRSGTACVRKGKPQSRYRISAIFRSRAGDASPAPRGGIGQRSNRPVLVAPGEGPHPGPRRSSDS